jgi:hypothetical protein
LKEDSNLSSIETEIFSDESNIPKNNTTSDNTISNKTTYILGFSILTIVVVSGINIYYYYPEVLNYFKDIDNDDNDSDLLKSPITESPTSPTHSDYFKDLSEMETPKASSSNSPTS